MRVYCAYIACTVCTVNADDAGHCRRDDAAEVSDADVRLDPAEHAEHAWLPYATCLDRVHYRGLKDGLRSVQEYVTGPATPARELRLLP